MGTVAYMSPEQARDDLKSPPTTRHDSLEIASNALCFTEHARATGRHRPLVRRPARPPLHSDEKDLLFPNRAGTRPRKRESAVQYALKPLLRKLGIDDKGGLHAFRHGLATELAEASVPLTVLQTQMRHADVKTTLRVYAHIIPQSQREAMERASLAIGTNVSSWNRKGELTRLF